MRKFIAIVLLGRLQVQFIDNFMFVQCLTEQISIISIFPWVIS